MGPSDDLIKEFCRDRSLTPREEQILIGVCRGLKNSGIGEKLEVSDATVRLHMTNLHRKLGTTSKVDLVLKLWDWSIQNSGLSDGATQRRLNPGRLSDVRGSVHPEVH